MPGLLLAVSWLAAAVGWAESGAIHESGSVRKPQLQKPIPFAVAASLKAISAYDLSPDGKWIAVIFRDPQAGKNRLSITETATGWTIEPHGAAAESSLAQWSPDSARLAYLCDAAGAPAVWLWERDTRKSREIRSAEVAAVAGYSAPLTWLSNSRQLLVPHLLPKGSARPVEDPVARARAVWRPPFKSVGPEESSVVVLRANMESLPDTFREEDFFKDQSLTPAPCGGGKGCELGLVDVSSGAVCTLARGSIELVWVGASPSGRYAAYSERAPDAPRAAWGPAAHRIRIIDLHSGRELSVRAPVRGFVAAQTVSWSPDSRKIAYQSAGRISIVTVESGATVATAENGLPNFGAIALREGTADPPAWSADSRHLYSLTERGDLWVIETSTAKAARAVSIAGRQIRGFIVARSGRVPRVWVGAASPDRQLAGIYEADLESGRSRRLMEAPQRLEVFGFNGNASRGVVTFMVSDQQHPTQVRELNVKTGRVRTLTNIHEEFSRYRLGKARIVSWRRSDGLELRGSLLLPPDYRAGRRYPMLTWVYASGTGERGSEFVNTFGLVPPGDSVIVYNMQILATRGYAIFWPDIPVRAGRQMQDIYAAVMPGLDAVIEQGYADPDRLAVAGASHGSYVTLALLTQTTRFKAAVITAAVADPNRFSQYVAMAPASHADMTKVLELGQPLMEGSPWQYPQRYHDESPFFFFDRVKTPLLIAQGELDALPLPFTAANATYASFRKLGIPVEYRMYENEGHAIMHRNNVVDFLNARLRFFAQYLDLSLDENGAIVFENGWAKSRSAN